MLVEATSNDCVASTERPRRELVQQLDPPNRQKPPQTPNFPENPALPRNPPGIPTEFILSAIQKPTEFH